MHHIVTPTGRSITLVSKWESATGSGAILTLLTNDELGKWIRLRYFNEVFFSTANLARAGIVMGGITKGCIDPNRHTDQKSLEATVKSAGLTTGFVDDIFESLDILKKK